jgi:hypothetical protein
MERMQAFEFYIAHQRIICRDFLEKLTQKKYPKREYLTPTKSTMYKEAL